MPRPRKRQTGLPGYCYKDRNGRLYMLHPAGRKDDGSLRLRRVTYDDLDALLAAWRVTWGEAAREGGETVGALLDAFLAGLGERVKHGELSATTAAKLANPAMPRWTFNDLRAKAGSESKDWRILGHLDQRTFERVYNRLPRKVAPTR